ncbi:hypothetical protein M378DRAFT_16913 [Amanita muscaria Koide BX008]|uniref:Uncharacterized protein n=1 Tax=Amanita muscaria (strain Koide BX008) TaxID=946122 RepID=A0A0C2WKD4_AMAMK|nr:hypothetical protein M378DRAFT_16913 [Amanita muscaria Koide BX008]
MARSFVYGIQLRAAQRMLNFDYSVAEQAPSILLTEGSRRRHQHIVNFAHSQSVYSSTLECFTYPQLKAIASQGDIQRREGLGSVVLVIGPATHSIGSVGGVSGISSVSGRGSGTITAGITNINGLNGIPRYGLSGTTTTIVPHQHSPVVGSQLSSAGYRPGSTSTTSALTSAQRGGGVAAGGVGRTNTNGRNGTPTMIATVNLAQIAGSSSAAGVGSSTSNPGCSPSSSTTTLTRPGPLGLCRSSAYTGVLASLFYGCTGVCAPRVARGEVSARFGCVVVDEKNGWESVVQLAEPYIYERKKRFTILHL